MPTANPRVVVSLSTIPSRSKDLEPTLVSLAAQTLKPDAIYVSIPRHSTREDVDYPIKAIAKVVKRVLPGVGRVAVVDDDYGPLTKLMAPLLHEDSPTTLIVTVDDDQQYDPRFVETLVTGAARHPKAAVCLCGHVLGKFPSVWGFRSSRCDKTWPLKTIYLAPDTRVDIVSGWCGVLYPRGVFGEDVPHPAMEDLRLEKLKILHKHDDLYISAWLDLLGVEKYVVAYEGAHGDKQLEHAYKNALSTGNKGRTPAAGLKHMREYWGVIRALRSRGMLCSTLRVPWYNSTVTMATVAGVAALVMVAGTSFFLYRHFVTQKNRV
jgi:hypothetical protein